MPATMTASVHYRPGIRCIYPSRLSLQSSSCLWQDSPQANHKGGRRGGSRAAPTRVWEPSHLVCDSPLRIFGGDIILSWTAFQAFRRIKMTHRLLHRVITPVTVLLVFT